MTDEELFLSFLNGDEAMFETLVKRYQRPLYGYLLRYTGNTTLAEEIFQETFCKIFFKKESFKRDKPFKPWLYQIATNTAHDKYRLKKFQPLPIEEHNEPSAKTADLPAQCAERQELAQQIANAVAQLSDMQRQVFILREYEQLSYAEISTMMQRPVNTVKSDMHRALQALRTLLDSLADVALEGDGR